MSTPVLTWDLVPGDPVRRRDLNARFGGRWQGGMTTSRSTPNLFLFTDPSVGNQHGYYDGWVGDVFHYTGMGQSGDQRLSDANLALLEHEQRGLAVRLFRGVGGTITYLGEFRVDDQDPYYRMEAGETRGPDVRQVIVFHLLPVGAVVHEPMDALVLPDTVSPSEVITALEDKETSVTEVPIEAQNVESFPVNAHSDGHTATRREQALVTRYRDYLDGKGITAIRLRIQPAGEARPLFSDVFEPGRKNLVEAKGTGTRTAVRMAIGQLADYGRFAPPDVSRAVLLPERPRPDLEALLGGLGVSAVWETPAGFEDNADGRFT